MMNNNYSLGIDIGSTTVKIVLMDNENEILFSDYERHYANIQETLANLINKSITALGDLDIKPVITGSGGLSIPLFRRFICPRGYSSSNFTTKLCSSYRCGHRTGR